MPIRFRCAYCNQLMGIARRKASTVVRCPTCSGQVVVPNPDPERDEAQDIPAGPNLFEGSDIEQVLQLPNPAPEPAYAAGAPPRPAPPPAPAGAWGNHAEPEYAPPRGAQASSPAPLPVLPPGILLSPTRATLLAVGGILALAVAFAAGVVVGRFLLT